MLVTPAGIVIEVSEVAPSNAPSPIVVTLAGIVKPSSEAAPANA